MHNWFNSDCLGGWGVEAVYAGCALHFSALLVVVSWQLSLQGFNNNDVNNNNIVKKRKEKKEYNNANYISSGEK